MNIFYFDSRIRNRNTTFKASKISLKFSHQITLMVKFGGTSTTINFYNSACLEGILKGDEVFWDTHRHTHTYTHIYTHTHTYTHICTHTHIYTHKHTYTHTYINTHKNPHTYTHKHIHIHIHIHTHIHTNTYTNIHTHTNTHIHTHTHTLFHVQVFIEATFIFFILLMKFNYSVMKCMRCQKKKKELIRKRSL